MKTQTTGALIDAKTQEKPISYKHRLGLGKLLGHPLDFSASPMASQAIMRANAVAQAPQQQPEKKSKNKIFFSSTCLPNHQSIRRPEMKFLYT